MLTTTTYFDVRLYLQSGRRNGEVALYKQSNYPGSEPVLLGNFSEDKAGKINLVLEPNSGIKLLATAPPVEIAHDQEIPF